jgi:hypothetical protein
MGGWLVLEGRAGRRIGPVGGMDDSFPAAVSYWNIGNLRRSIDPTRPNTTDEAVARSRSDDDSRRGGLFRCSSFYHPALLLITKKAAFVTVLGNAKSFCRSKTLLRPSKVQEVVAYIIAAVMSVIARHTPEDNIVRHGHTTTSATVAAWKQEQRGTTFFGRSSATGPIYY